MKKSLFKVALMGVLAFIGVMNANADNDLSVQPFEIGPGKIVTVNVHISNANAKIDIVKLWFNLPAGVHVKGIDPEESGDIDESLFSVKDLVTSGALEFVFNYKPERGNGEYKFSLLTADGKFAFKGDALTDTGSDFFSFDVECDESVEANANATIEFMPKTELSGSTEDFIYSGEEGNLPLPEPAVAVYDKFPAKISASGYTTICSTTDLDFSAVEGLTAYVVSKADGEKATLTKIENAPAGTGVILKGTAGETVQIPTGSATAPADNKLVGVTARTSITGDGSQFFLVKGKFVKAAEVSTVPAGKAYLVASAGAKAFDVLDIEFDDDEATAIKNVENEQFEGVIYNLNGVRVDNPTKGVYVKNGKKFVVK